MYTQFNHIGEIKWDIEALRVMILTPDQSKKLLL